jgi:dihydrofolate reductase
MKATVFVGVSVDGFLARPDGSFDFLPTDGGEDHGFREFLASVDVLIMGRKTYESVLPFDSWPYGATPVIVLSSRPLAPAPSGVTVEHMNGEPTEIVAKLEARGIRHAYVDGGVTIQAFLRAGLITQLVVTRVPVLIGEGLPLFGATGRDIRLTHVSTKSYPSGLVSSVYDVG